LWNFLKILKNHLDFTTLTALAELIFGPSVSLFGHLKVTRVLFPQNNRIVFTVKRSKSIDHHITDLAAAESDS